MAGGRTEPWAWDDSDPHWTWKVVRAIAGTIGVIAACLAAYIAWLTYRDQQESRPNAPTIVSVWHPDTQVRSSSTSPGLGMCIASVVSDRSDAYRCFYKPGDRPGSEVSDPCFPSVTPSGQPGRVQCIRDPWSRRGTIVRMSQPLPVHAGRDGGPLATPLEHQPWALSLRDGTKCIAHAGATDVVADTRVNYLCRERGERLDGFGPYVIGQVSRSGLIWTVVVRNNLGAGTEVEVDSVWI